MSELRTEKATFWSTVKCKIQYRILELFPKKSNLIEHAERELKLAGYNIKNKKFDYGDSCAQNAIEMLKVFSKAGHSGFSANATLQLFNKLANFENLTSLSNNLDEWVDVSEMQGNKKGINFQSIRNYECFSDDGLKNYYKLSDMKVDSEDGYTTTDRSKKVLYPLKDGKDEL